LQINADEDGNYATPADLAKIRAQFPFANRIVLSVNRSVIQTGPVSDQLRRIVDWIRRFDEVVSAVLVDSSEGKGEEIDADWASIVVKETAATFPGLVIGIAGGFRPENVALKLQSIMKPPWRTPFSIDAQSGLRSGDYISHERVRRYVADAVRTFQTCIE
jgi:phosphoribosylanthranilate isomerase